MGFGLPTAGRRTHGQGRAGADHRSGAEGVRDGTDMTAIIAALSVFDPIVGELSDLVVEWMALPEPVKIVQASTEIMTH